MNGASRHILSQEWPEFLDLLDTDSRRALEEFYTFARTLLSVAPPRNLWEIPEDQRDDMIHDLVLECCRSDFRILRRYQNCGHPFAAWFALVARNKMADWLRRNRKISDRRWAQGRSFSPPTPATISPEREVLNRMALEKVTGHIEALGDICRLLLLGAAEGMKPRELVQVLGWPDDWNKKASDDLRECRKRLRRRLERDGVDLEELVAP